jgi:hypothetical protein
MAFDQLAYVFEMEEPNNEVKFGELELYYFSSPEYSLYLLHRPFLEDPVGKLQTKWEWWFGELGRI